MENLRERNNTSKYSKFFFPSQHRTQQPHPQFFASKEKKKKAQFINLFTAHTLLFHFNLFFVSYDHYTLSLFI